MKSAPKRAKCFLTDEHVQCIVRMHQEFKDKPSFTNVLPIKDI